MADAKTPIAPIRGDISTASEVTVNRKGGSLTATLKKALRERIGLVGNRMHAAALQFGGGQSVLLLRGDADGPSSLQVTQTGRNRFEIELTDGQEDEPVDELTAAFLKIKTELAIAGRLTFVAPMSADELERGMARLFELADKAADERYRVEPGGTR